MLPAMLGLGGLTAKVIATAVIPGVVRAIRQSFSTTRAPEACPSPPVEGISSGPEPAPAPVLSGVSGTRIRSRKWGYAGLWHHSASGLDLATYRLYDAANKRWISRDPLGEGVDYNLYRYCGNDPINCVDPLGFKKVTLFSDQSNIFDPTSGIVTASLRIIAVWDTCTKKLTIKLTIKNFLNSQMKVWGRLNVWSDNETNKIPFDVTVAPKGSPTDIPPIEVDVSPQTVDLHLNVNLRLLHYPTQIPDGVRVHYPVPYSSGTATGRNPDIRNN